MVFVPAGVWVLSSAHPTVGGHRQTESTDQRGSEVRLAACYSGHVHQQVQTQTQRHACHYNHIQILYNRFYSILKMFTNVLYPVSYANITLSKPFNID